MHHAGNKITTYYAERDGKRDQPEQFEFVKS